MLKQINEEKLSSRKRQLLNKCNDHFLCFKKSFFVEGLQASFSSAQKASQLNGFFTSACVEGTIQGKDYEAVDTVLSFIAALPDQAIGNRLGREPSLNNSSHAVLRHC